MDLTINMAALAGVLGTTAEELTDALKEGEGLKAEGEIVQFLKTKVDDIAYAARREAKEKHYSRGRSEALSAKEKELREQYGLEGRTLSDMFEELLDRAKNKPQLTPEDVRNTEIYKLDMADAKAKLQKAEERATQAESDYTSKLVQLRVKERGRALMEQHGFVTPEGVADATAWEDLLYSRLNNGTARLKLDGESIVVVNEQGAVLQDDRLQDISFDDYFVQQAGKLFKQAASDDRKSPGNQNQPQPGAAGGSVGPKPESVDAYLQTMASLKGEDRKNYIQKYGAAFE